MATTTTVVKGSLGEKLMLGETIAVIDGVVAAYPLDEEDREVNPIVIADDNQAAFWTVTGYGIGSYNYTGANDSADKQAGIDSYALTRIAGVYNGVNIEHVYDVNQDWSAKNKIRLYFKGTATTKDFPILLSTGDASLTNYFVYTITDTSSEWRWLDIPFASFSVGAGSPSWAAVRMIRLQIPSGSSGFMTSVKIDRVVVDVGVPALDYSGNGNHGAATGTTIVQNPIFIGKTARKFTGYDGITSPFKIADHCPHAQSVVVILSQASNPYSWTGILTFDIVDQRDFYFVTRTSPALGVTYGFRVTPPQMTEDEFAATANTPFSVGLTIDKTEKIGKVYANGALRRTIDRSAATSFNSATRNYMSIGRRDTSAIASQITVCGVYVFNRVLSEQEMSAFNLNTYPDPRLEPGKIHFRKIKNLQHKINQIIAPKLAAGKKAVVKTTEIGDEAWAVIVTEN